MLDKRILGAIIIAAVSFSLLFAGGWVYITGIALILSTAVFEYVRMFNQGEFHPDEILPTLGTFAIVLLSNLQDKTYIALAAILTIFAILLLKIIKYKKVKQTAAIDLTAELSALAFISFPGLFLVTIRMMNNGIYWMLISILPACTSDIGAFLIGCKFGKHKLAPELSPNKTIAGYFGGIFFALISGVIIGFLYKSLAPSITVLTTTLISLIIGIMSPFGDLAKSIFKRNFDLNDTGSIIPGHGGILDRIDTWLWAAPLSYFLIIFFIK